MDGTSGTYHVDESNDRIRITSVDGLPLAPGRVARVEATAWASSVFFKLDQLNLYYAVNPTTNPAWTKFATFNAARPGATVYSATFAIPPAKVVAVRAQFNLTAASGACASNNYGDHDDLLFPLANLIPEANAGGPYTGVIGGQPVSFDGRASTDGNGDSLTYRWSFGDGTTGTGATPSHAYPAQGTYTATLVVNDGQADSRPPRRR